MSNWKATAISVDDEFMELIDSAKVKLGYSNRSLFIRDAIVAFLKSKFQER